MFSAMTFEPGLLNLVDQRLLPAEEVWIRCTDSEAVAQAIETMVVRGGSRDWVHGGFWSGDRCSSQSRKCARRR